jgi:hypothetical protein
MDAMRIRRIAARAHTVRHCCTLDNHTPSEASRAIDDPDQRASSAGSRAAT